jgi:hypothetical protein
LQKLGIKSRRLINFPGRAHYINPTRKQGDKISVTNNYPGGEYGKHDITAADGIFHKHRRSQKGDKKQEIPAY